MSRISETDTQLIEKHLEKHLTEQEQTTFNQRLSDPIFANEVQLYQKAVQSVYAFGDAQLKMMLQAEEAKLQTKETENRTPQYKPTPIRPMWQKWAMAASFLLLASVAAWLLLPMGKKVENRGGVFATNFKPYRNYENPNVRSESPKNTLEKAYALYDNQEYAEAATAFEQINPLASNATFFQANAYLASNQAEKAVPILEELSTDATSKWRQYAQWYLALTLSDKQPERASTLFQKIKETPNHPYQAQAAAVLEGN